jgi:hypothetical protein
VNLRRRKLAVAFVVIYDANVLYPSTVRDLLSASPTPTASSPLSDPGSEPQPINQIRR